MRESAVFSGIPLVERARERTCGVWVVNVENGQTIGYLSFQSSVQDIFAGQFLSAMRFPELLEWSDQHLANSYVLPDEALADVVMPTVETEVFNSQNSNQCPERSRKIEIPNPKQIQLTP